MAMLTTLGSAHSWAAWPVALPCRGGNRLPPGRAKNKYDLPIHHCCLPSAAWPSQRPLSAGPRARALRLVSPRLVSARLV